MKIMIFYPETYEIARYGKERKEYPPFGVLYLAAVIEQRKFDVQISKICSSSDVFDLTKYDVIMYSLSSSCTYRMMLQSKRCSLFSIGAKIVLGGIHASIFPHASMIDFEADYLVKGEGEIAISKILDSLVCGTKSLNVKGVATSNLRNINELENADYVADLDELPFPARHLLPIEDVILTGRLSIRDMKMAHILASRGCPFSCYFCGGINKNHRYRSPDNILEELILLKETYGIQGFVINDENFIINRKKVIEICGRISPLKMPWSALSRIDTVNEDIVRALVGANCIELKFGLESGSNRMLEYMNKGNDICMAQQTIDLCYAYNIKVKLFLIHGFPGEDEFTTQETVRFLDMNCKKIDRVSLFRWTPLPGSYVYNNYERYDLNRDKLSFENAVIYQDESNWFNDGNTNQIINEQYVVLKKSVEENFG